MEFGKIRKLIEAGFSDEEIEKFIHIEKSEEKPKEPEKKPDEKPKEPEKKPEEKPENNNADMIAAIKSLEMTIRASNLVNSTIPTIANKSADEALASWIEPNRKDDK